MSSAAAGTLPDQPPVKLTFLIDSMRSRGGMERATASVAAGLAARGLDLQILTLRGDTSAFDLPGSVKLQSLGLPEGPLRMRGDTLPMMLALRREVRRRRPNVLVAVDTFLSAFAFPAVLDLPVRRVAWEHFNFHTDLGMRSRRLGRQASALLGHHVVILTEQDAAVWRRAFPQACASIEVISNPLPLAQPAVNPYSPGHRTVLAAGRLDGQKGFDLLLGAWAQVESDFPEWSLKIVGEGIERGRLQEQIVRLGLRRAALPGPSADMEGEYKSTGVFCLSSRHEGLPMVLIESQAYGVPAVAFDCPLGPAEILAPGGGLLVKPGDVAGLAGALRRALLEPGTRREMSGRAYEGARRYEAEHIFNRWTSLIAVRPQASPRRPPSAEPGGTLRVKVGRR